MKYSRLVAITSAVAASFMTLGAAPAPPESQAPQWLPEIADSADLSTEVVASGRALDPQGRPLAAGSQVELYAWPATEVLAAVKIGESITLTPVGKAQTRANGSFELRLDDGVDLGRFANSIGTIDLEVQAWGPDSLSVVHFSRALPGASALNGALPDQAQANGARSLALEESPSRGLEMRGRHQPEAASAHANPQAGPLNKSIYCWDTKLATYPARQTQVGTTYVTVPSANATFSYTAGASNTLGVAVSATGAAGSFKASGTSTLSSSGVPEWGARTGNVSYSTFFTYEKWQRSCQDVYIQPDPWIVNVTVKATRFDGGTAVGSPALPTANYCVPLARNSSYTITSTKASTNSTGVSLSSAIGINVSSQAGYSTVVKAKYTNTSLSIDRRLCGVSGYPGNSSPGRLVLK